MNLRKALKLELTKQDKSFKDLYTHLGLTRQRFESLIQANEKIKFVKLCEICNFLNMTIANFTQQYWSV
jgi:DNA-binding Xre family transcriptional regulator